MWKFREKESKEEVAAPAEKAPHMSIDIYFKDGRRLSSFSCKIEEDTDRGAFNDVCKWFCSQKSPTYTFHYKTGFLILVRSEITGIQVYEELK